MKRKIRGFAELGPIMTKKFPDFDVAILKRGLIYKPSDVTIYKKGQVLDTSKFWSKSKKGIEVNADNILEVLKDITRKIKLLEKKHGGPVCTKCWKPMIKESKYSYYCPCMPNFRLNRG